ncbi:MAG: transcriptional regulator [Cyanobacteriota bacterium]|nr:transcriptional regulator [Cyanobacteriota bacterium]
MTTVLNPNVYGSLLVQYQPQAINSQSEYERSCEIIEQLMERGEDLTAEEGSLLEVLAVLVEAYEDERLPSEPSSPQAVLLHLMNAQELKQVNLVDIIGSKGLVSEIVNGKREISKSQAKALGEFFNVSPALFI